jgi:maltose/moltooligosaccharide transporter
MTGLIIQPIIGYFQTGLGQNGTKKTLLLAGYFSFGSIFIMPNSPTLWFAAGMLWIMDASINVSMEPFRALLAIIFRKNNVPWVCHAKFFYWLALTSHQNYR